MYVCVYVCIYVCVYMYACVYVWRLGRGFSIKQGKGFIYLTVHSTP